VEALSYSANKHYEPMELSVDLLSLILWVAVSALSLAPFSFVLARGRKTYPDGYVVEKIKERKRKGKSLDSRFVPQYLVNLAHQRHEDWNQVLKKAGLDPRKEKAGDEDLERVLAKLGFNPRRSPLYAPSCLVAGRSGGEGFAVSQGKR
jgi:hypothetical protein